MPPSSTWFTANPDWTWWIVLYFFLGGLAAGAYTVASLVELVGGAAELRLARVGYLIALPLMVVAGPMLIVDLGRPERFWHMLLQSQTMLPMLKLWSPMSLGAWVVGGFGAFALLSFLLELAALGETGLGALRRGLIGKLIALLGLLLALAMATYPGILLATTNRPFWADTGMLGALFVASSTASGVAAIELINRFRRLPSTGLVGEGRLRRFSQFAIVLTLVVLVGTLATLGPVMQVFANVYGVVLGVGVGLIGLLLPLLLNWRPRLLGASTIAAAAVLELIGGLLLRWVVLMANAGINATPGSG